MFKILIFSLLITSISQVSGNETCSRVALINYQEVLVDSSSTKKGEGLRYYLEKDPLAKNYLEKYQSGAGIRWQNAALGSIGAGMVLSTIFMDDKGSKRELFVISGLALLAVNFLMATTLDYYNESNLYRAIEEYNRRNLPKINFKSSRPLDKKNTKYDVSLEKNWGF